MTQEIRVLMADHCTRHEAERHLRKGTIIWDTVSDFIGNLEENGLLEEALEAHKCKTVGELDQEIREGRYEDVSVVELDGEYYCIEYAL